jgi:carbon monoxide dehydrogenase subunit G
MELDHEFTVPVPAEEAWPVLLDVERIAPCMPGATLDSVDGDEFTGRLKVRLGAMTITYRGSARIAARDEDARTVTIEGTGKEARGSGTASATVQAQLHDEGARTRVTVHTKLNVTGRPAQFGRNILAEVGGKLISRFADNLATEITRDEPAETAPEATSTAAPESPSESVSGAAPEAAPEAAAGTAAEVTTEADASPAGRPQAAAEPTPSGAPEAVVPDAEPQVAPAPAGEGAAEAPKRAADRPTPRASDDEAINLLEFAGPSIAKRLAPVLAGLAAVWALRRFRRRRGRGSSK